MTSLSKKLIFKMKSLWFVVYDTCKALYYNCSYAYVDPPQFLPSLLETGESGYVAVSIGGFKARISTGSVVVVYCNVTGIDIPSIEWFKDDTQISSGGKLSITRSSSHSHITEVLTINNFQPQDAGIYQCLATNIAGSVSGNITLRS